MESNPNQLATLVQTEVHSAQASVPTSVQGKATKITIIIPKDAYFLSGIRDFTLSLTRNMTGFSNQWAYRFQSVVDELCNNAIEHGSGPSQEIKLNFFSKVGEYIELIVEDSGTGHAKVKADDMKNLVFERSHPEYLKSIGLRGRGLAQIVSSWTDELEFKNSEKGGLVVRVRKYLKHEDAQMEGSHK